MARKRAIFFFLIPIFFSAAPACTTVLFYHPTREIYLDPGRMGFRYENRWLMARDGTRLHGILVHHASSSVDRKATVLFLHGNGENLSSHFIVVAWLANLGYDLLLFDYRGYGRSEGEIDHEEIQQDALSMVRDGSLLAEATGQRLVVYGQSLGGILSARALLRWKDEYPREFVKLHPALIILDSTFGSYREISRDKLTSGCLPLLRPFVSVTISEDEALGDRLQELSPIPLIMIHGEKDDIVPIRFGEALFATARQPKRWLAVPGAGHGSGIALGQSQAARDLFRMMDEVLSR